MCVSPGSEMQFITELHHFWQLLLRDLSQMQTLEPIAVIFALLYLVLAVRENSLCWYAAFISTTLYTLIFWDSALLMESALQLYYLVMAVYGWRQWRRPDINSQPLQIQRWGIQKHLGAVAAVVVLTVCSGYLLSENTRAALPYLDSFTTWGAVITTYMVTKKVFENWLYWLLIDGVCIYLYWDRGLILTAGLFVLYEIIVVVGLITWWKTLQQQNLAATSSA